MATAVQMSSHHFASLFKESVGRPPHQYFSRCLYYSGVAYGKEVQPYSLLPAPCSGVPYPSHTI
ncbi:MAG: hypothetical protein WA865_04990 [Spirulinaceae cyanobacterium]